MIVANYPDRAWKSKKHHDGTMYDNMFIVGIDTPTGQATYHYDIDPYWDMFACKVLENAPEWDGHTSAQAIERIGKLKAQEPATIKPKRIDLEEETKAWLDKMDAVDALGNIADICIDWDGYRTADGLGGLVNEIWAYAKYCAERLAKAQEPRAMTLEEVEKTYSKRPIWFEQVRLQTIYPAIYHKTGGPEGCKFAVITDFYYGKQNWAYGTYGKDWRCWDKEPTDKQRRNEPWTL